MRRITASVLVLFAALGLATNCRQSSGDNSSSGSSNNVDRYQILVDALDQNGWESYQKTRVADNAQVELNGNKVVLGFLTEKSKEFSVLSVNDHCRPFSGNVVALQEQKNLTPGEATSIIARISGSNASICSASDGANSNL